MMRTHTWLRIGVILALVLAVAGCSDDGGETTSTTAASTTTSTTTTAPTTTTTRPAPTTTLPEVVPLVVWTPEGLAGLLRPAAARFEADFGIPVELVEVEAGPETLREPAVEADIVFGHHAWIGELAEGGIIDPIDLGVRTDVWLPAAVDAFEFEGRHYGVPLTIDGTALYVDTELVPEVPGSFADLQETCDGLGDTIGSCLGHPDIDDGLGHSAFLVSTGGYLFGFDRDTGYDLEDVGLTVPGAVTGITVLDGLVAGGYVDAAAGSDDLAGDFIDGSTPMMMAGAGELQTLLGTETAFTVGPLPEIDGATARPYLSATGFLITAGTTMDVAALAFLLDYVSDPEIAAGLPSTQPGLPAVVAAIDLLEGQEYVQGLLEAFAAGSPAPNIPEATTALAAYGRAVERIYQQGAEPEVALELEASELRRTLRD